MRDRTSYGFVGSDRIAEDQCDWYQETLEPIQNEKGQPLRFALIARDADRLKAKLARSEPLSVITSYPTIALSKLGVKNTVEYVGGCVEAEVLDRGEEVDAAFELVQSGDSVRENRLEIVEDDIEQVWLTLLRTPYDW
jgi:ATP phosphoribosyltransferase